MMNLEDFIKDLSPELQEMARKCGSAEELLALAGERKVPLPAEALEAIAGGNGSPQNCGGARCPKCGGTNLTKEKVDYSSGDPIVHYKCNSCGDEFVIHMYH